MKKGLVFSGGAAWGFANVGVLAVLEREGIAIDCIAGSSMGAIVAGAYALGMSVRKIEEMSTKVTMLNVAKRASHPLRAGLHSGILHHQLEAMLRPFLGSATIGDCKIPFVCMAGKIRRPIQWMRILKPGFVEYFLECVEPTVFPPETPLMDALLATSAIPVLFAPVTIDGQEYVDLVHFGSIPARALRVIHDPDVVIGTDTNPRYGHLQKYLPSPWSEFLRRGHEEMLKDRDACDILIQPTMPHPVFRFDKATVMMEAGRLATEKMLPQIRMLLQENKE